MTAVDSRGRLCSSHTSLREITVWFLLKDLNLLLVSPLLPSSKPGEGSNESCRNLYWSEYPVPLLLSCTFVVVLALAFATLGGYLHIVRALRHGTSFLFDGSYV